MRCENAGATESSEDCLEAILVIRAERGFCRNADIAERLGVTRPSVTKALAGLSSRSLVEVAGRDVRLTPEGRRLAGATLEKHEFFRRLLVETASAEACRIEHCLSEDSCRRFAVYLLFAQSPLSIGRVPADGHHLPGCTWGNGLAGPRKVARRTRNIKHDRRGERQMPDPGRQHRGRRAFRPRPNNSSY